MNISDLIQKEVAALDIAPRTLNESAWGFFSKPSDMFATRIKIHLCEAVISFPDDMSMFGSDFFDPAAEKHYYIVYEGRFYDAETPFGVEHWDQLPFYTRRKYSSKRFGLVEGKITRIS